MMAKFSFEINSSKSFLCKNTLTYEQKIYVVIFGNVMSAGNYWLLFPICHTENNFAIMRKT